MYAPVVPALAEHHRLIVPDLRGMGASRILPGPYTPVQQAADLAELLRRLDVSRAAVLGTSQGGPVSMQLLHDHSNVVGRLILVCTYAYNLESIREKIEGFLVPWIMRFVGPRRIGEMMRTGNPTGGKRMTPEQGRWISAMVAGTPRQTAIPLAKGLVAFDGRPWLSQIKVPTLIVAGTHDEAVPPHHARLLAKGIADPRLVEIQGAGHLAVITNPDEFVQIVEDWLTETEPPR